jgi:hypothetical protein
MIKKRENHAANSCSSTTLSLILLLVVFIWFLAVIKIFLLQTNPALLLQNKSNILAAVQERPSITRQDIFKKPAQISKSPPVMHQQFLGSVPENADWQFIRSDPKSYNQILKNRKIVSQSNSAVNIIPHIRPANALEWPPVLSNFTIPATDGFDVMPTSGLKVPRFWEPRGDLFKSGLRVNDYETIFLMIASYRDFQCRETITSAYKKADHPERLFVGAVDQIIPGDTGCLDIDIPCSADNSQMICKYRNQISVYKMDAATATGPVTARHIGVNIYETRIRLEFDNKSDPLTIILCSFTLCPSLLMFYL